MPICLVLLVADDDNSTEIAVTVSIHKILFIILSSPQSPVDRSTVEDGARGTHD